jgi:hypothetical protein
VFPNAQFEGAPRKIWNLDPAAQLPPQTPSFGTGPGANQAFCGLTIAIEHAAADVPPGGKTAAAVPAEPKGN